MKCDIIYVALLIRAGSETAVEEQLLEMINPFYEGDEDGDVIDYWQRVPDVPAPVRGIEVRRSSILRARKDAEAVPKFLKVLRRDDALEKSANSRESTDR